MKLCTICDKKIEGTWCKNCRKFVKTYEISGGIYLNERHDPLNDNGCTYHTDPRTDSTKHVMREHTSVNTGMQRTYTSTTTSASVSGTNRSAEKKKGKKIALIIIVVYILVNCLGFIGPAIVRVVENVSGGYQEEVFEKELYDDEPELSEEELEEQFNRELRNAALLELKPVNCWEEEDFEVYYFNREDIEGIGYPCDSEHFDMTLEEFEAWLVEQRMYSFQFSEDYSIYSNWYIRYAEELYEIYDEDFCVQFACDRYYYGSDDFTIQADYDTATKQLHIVRIESKEGNFDMNLCMSLIKAFEPDTEWSEEQFAKTVEGAKTGGNYTTLYYTKEVHVAFETNEEGYSLVYYPVN